MVQFIHPKAHFAYLMPLIKNSQGIALSTSPHKQAKFLSNKTAQLTLILIGLLLTVAVVTWLNLPWRPDLHPILPDSGVYAYIGKAILHGQVLYRDVWDDKPPLGYYLNALVLSIFGQTTFGWWWAGIAWISGCSVLLFTVVKRLFGWITAGLAWALFLLMLMHPQLFGGGNLMEVFALVPQVGVIWLTYLYFNRQQKPLYAFLVGVVTAVAYMIKQPTIILGCSSIFLIVASSIRPGNIGEAMKSAVRFVAGFLSITALVALYWLLVGDFKDFMDGAILQGISFIGGTQSNFLKFFFYALVKELPKLRIGSLYLIALMSAGIFLAEKLYQNWLKPIVKNRLSWFEWGGVAALLIFPIFASWRWPRSYFGKFWLITIFALGLFFLVKFYRLKNRPPIDQVFTPLEWTWLAAVIALPFEVLMASLGGRYFGHYFITLIPAVTFSVAYPLWRIISTVQATIRSRSISFGLAAYLIPVILTFAWAASSFTAVLPPASDRNNLSAIFRNQSTANDLEQYIIQTTQPKDEVLVWHIHLGINFITERQAPSRFLFPLNLFIPASPANTRLKEYIDDLEANPPELILVQKVSSIAVPFVDQPIETACAVYCSPEFVQALEIPLINQQWHRLQEFFYSHYTLDTKIYDWTVYRLIP